MDLRFVKSSYSATSGQCVEVARNVPGLVAVRDSKDTHSPVLRFAPQQWAELTRGIKAGQHPS